ncbi:hypothetical protein BU14_0306s0010 [Porphyra umbilicalis]|uniref:Uncharacterized protein n=1 Tax=Porphyra umbilicalis TaxID=2786 RepID=A0A1X6P034_PORUM|nr:hypothetical protein BU14_0306s0010 [Porphyra umbilicalis]|eukprot:OSX74130.1 hypothetical protein BU14_0306s0010 [Porphyra umbilicalis]
MLHGRRVKKEGIVGVPRNEVNHQNDRRIQVAARLGATANAQAEEANDHLPQQPTRAKDGIQCVCTGTGPRALRQEPPQVQHRGDATQPREGHAGTGALGREDTVQAVLHVVQQLLAGALRQGGGPFGGAPAAPRPNPTVDIQGAATGGGRARPCWSGGRGHRSWRRRRMTRRPRPRRGRGQHIGRTPSRCGRRRQRGAAAMARGRRGCRPNGRPREAHPLEHNGRLCGQRRTRPG